MVNDGLMKRGKLWDLKSFVKHRNSMIINHYTLILDRTIFHYKKTVIILNVDFTLYNLIQVLRSLSKSDNVAANGSSSNRIGDFMSMFLN